MKIIDLLKREGISLNPDVKDKSGAIDFLVDLMDKSGRLSDKKEYKKGVLEREAQGTTGIGEGVAIPHSKNKAVKEAGLSAMVIKNGLDFESLDAQPAYLFFMIAAPDGENNVHLEVLSRLSTLLMDENFRQDLIDSKDKDEFLAMIDKAEKEKFKEEKAEEKAEADKEDDGYFDVLAVTACPTGIAHTYMAAEVMEKKAKEMGIKFKVETDGSGGVKNKLTKDEIEHAKCIIVAADREVEMARFNGKKVIQTKVANGINKAEELLTDAINKKAPIYEGGGEVVDDDGAKESIGRQIYKHLMNGVSHMLPFVIGGGILIALAFLFDDASLGAKTFGSNTPFAAFLKTIGDTAFGFMLPILAGYIAMSIGDRPALVTGFVGGAIANSGGSGFLGALLAGFIAGYLMVFLKKLFSKLPNSLEGMKPVLIYPLLGVLLIGAIMTFLVNPPVSILNTSLTNGLNAMGESSKVVLGIVLGAMMSIDMGGPFNKAAYVFGTASLTTGNYDIMAAVMIGGMVPPLAIALCATFFKNRFSKDERGSALTNYIMGASFITEGAIPFAAADPLRVIPSCAIGAGIAGGLSMLFGCTLRAPHGGLWVTAIIGNPLYYLAALAVGSLIGMALLAILKKPIHD
ncbi:phosphoenolpyruvate-dependent sugar phosphotransferase system, EIIA 2 [Anaerofustis stercorihominis DSM 17244]|uniref:Phosphoenolpyruvate-dependent sugar phosphotransferase system, EIIA 2 n=1 Tax=Anaerofustis stercorihominis DSM 17244 TaxID=445971 RepID=B1C8J3_9FIRM|nr:fructose-specific PTS transporter subunit EIIC [Anaerofustis stercorihominis]EDS71903.1 phosphoenolpyruvate-dependent sugar phosphotransferase system, EIIA 2 [Anaerofustis stercorihominis DSM 17244]